MRMKLSPPALPNELTFEKAFKAKRPPCAATIGNGSSGGRRRPRTVRILTFFPGFDAPQNGGLRRPSGRWPICSSGWASH